MEQVTQYEIPQTDEQWEMPQEEPASNGAAPVVCVVKMPEDPSPEDITRVLEAYKQQAQALIPKDDITAKACSIFEEECKLAAKRVEEKRLALIAPHLSAVQQWREINATHNPAKDAFDAMARAIGGRVCLYIEQKRREQEQEQARLNAEAARKRAEEERNAQIAREEAEKARQAGDETQAVQWEAAAEEAEMKAVESAAPAVVEQQAKTIDLGDSSMTYKKSKPDWNLPGWDKKEKLPVIVQGKVDHRLNGLIGDLKKLPEGLQWLLRFVEINPVLLNKACANEQFPAPFTMTKKPGGSMLRGKG